jgi:hypothetical protein
MTIIPSDGHASIDGVWKSIAGLQALLPTIHAIQWHTDKGEIEFIDKSTPNEPITSVSQFQAVIDLWNAPPPVVVKTLEQVKDTQLAAMDSAYDTANQLPISYMTTTFQADAESQSLMAAVLTASGGSLPNGFAWFDTNNSPVEMTFAQLQGLAGSILLRGQPLFVTKQAKKALIRAATTIQQVESITW